MALGTFHVDRKPDGGITISITDTDVTYFGGGCIDMYYFLTAKGVKTLEEELSKIHKGTLEEMIAEEFGLHLEKQRFGIWLDEKGVEYRYDSWRD